MSAIVFLSYTLIFYGFLSHNLFETITGFSYSLNEQYVIIYWFKNNFVYEIITVLWTEDDVCQMKTY